jgi:hypothetical protein
MNIIEYKISQANFNDIETFFENCSYLFNPSLNACVNIHEYAKKIYQFATTFEAWNNIELIGLVACYLNNTNTFEGYISV